MNRFSKTQIYLHWITLLFVAITYAAMELDW
ncbi:cytochrome b, partial [Escherichia coli]|nr:cytochrome b [Escherichia coli]